MCRQKVPCRRPAAEMTRRQPESQPDEKRDWCHAPRQPALSQSTHVVADLGRFFGVAHVAHEVSWHRHQEARLAQPARAVEVRSSGTGDTAAGRTRPW